MAITFKIDTDFKALERVTRDLDALPDDLQRAVAETVRTAQPIRDEIATYPGAVKYPIQWTSERQRKAFFATNGFGAGIPYQRTGGLGQAWKLLSVNTGNGAMLVLENRANAAKYVYGFFGQPRPQQRFHVNTGWQTISQNNPGVRIRSLLIDELIQNIIEELAKRK